MNRPMVIIGAGLSGLLTAYRLKKSGIKVKVLEARDRIGGRILTTKGAADIPVEMGATWFGPQHQNLRSLLRELGIPAFEQYMKGEVFFEASPLSPPQAIKIPPQAPSFRIAGGTERLIQELASHLTREEISLNQAVKEIDLQSDEIGIETEAGRYVANKVVCCIPPALLVSDIQVLPGLPEHFETIARNTHTWMQEAIKAGVVYKKPFWKDRKISAVFSNDGPVTEFHDHSDAANSRFALCGFLHPQYGNYGKKEREEKVIDQLERLFGKEAGEYMSYSEIVWQDERFTSGKRSARLQPHENNGNAVYGEPLFAGRLIISGAETSPVYGGYMEGAVYSGNQAARKILNSG